MMFSDSDTDSQGFASHWKFSRSSVDSCVQTAEVVGDDKNIQTRECHPVAVQTDEDAGQSAAVAYDEARLAAFLGQICPEVIKELDRVSQVNASISYTMAPDTDGEVKEVLTLAAPSGDDIKVSDISWSCTGSVLAVARSHSLHPSWCAHHGKVTLHNVDREARTAGRTLDAPSCIRSVSMHPYLSSIVAAGTYSGDVLVWDTAREGAEAALVNATHTTHNDSVTQVRWVLGVGTAVVLVSSALDGHLIFWKASPLLSSYHTLERYSCDLSGAEPGITCFAFPLHQQDTFVVALEGGALLQCSTAAAKPIPSATVHSEVTKNPVISSFETQHATVLCVDFSPHKNDIFATVSTDQAIRIYSLYQNNVQLVIWGPGALVGLCWAPTQAHVLAGWGDSGLVTLYNSHTGTTLSTFYPENTEPKSQISAVAFNAKSPSLLGVGDLGGVAHVWEIPTNFPTKPKHL